MRPRVGRKRRVIVAASSVVVLAGLAAGYVAADGAGIVPGPFTTAEPWPTPEPFPSPSLTSPLVLPAVLPDPFPGAPLPTAAGLQGALDSLLAAPELGTPAGVLVVDLATGEPIIGAYEGLARKPASTTKVLTAAAAVATLDLAATLPTTTVLTGTDEVILIGGGDIALAAGAGDPSAVVGRAGLGDLAAATAAALTDRGLTSVTVRMDDSLFGGSTQAQGWSSIDFTGGFVAPIHPLGINVGLIEGRDQRDTDPAAGAAAVFAQALRDNGIEVRDWSLRTRAPAEVVELARVNSAPLGQLLDLAMADSDNTLTEVFGRLVAIAAGEPATFEGAATATLAAIAGLGVDVSGTVLNDASGLSSNNRISPKLLTDLLVKGATDPALRPLAVSLPVAGLEGTLSERNLDDGQVRAKTGTLPGVVSLAGYTVTADGRAVVFAVMADGVPPAGSYAARIEIDEWVRTLTACGC